MMFLTSLQREEMLLTMNIGCLVVKRQVLDYLVVPSHEVLYFVFSFPLTLSISKLPLISASFFLSENV